MILDVGKGRTGIARCDGRASTIKKTGDSFTYEKASWVGIAALAIILGFVSPAPAWEVTVTNDTPNSVTIELYINYLVVNEVWKNHTIFPHQTHTFNTGVLCPSGFTGWVNANFWHSSPTLAATSVLGHETAVAGFSAGCWNSSWKICKKRGADGPYAYIENGDYSFCKQ